MTSTHESPTPPSLNSPMPHREYNNQSKQDQGNWKPEAQRIKRVEGGGASTRVRAIYTFRWGREIAFWISFYTPQERPHRRGRKGIQGVDERCLDKIGFRERLKENLGHIIKIRYIVSNPPTIVERNHQRKQRGRKWWECWSVENGRGKREERWGENRGLRL